MINQINEVAKLITLEEAFTFAIIGAIAKFLFSIVVNMAKLKKVTFNKYSILSIMRGICYYSMFTINLTIFMLGFYSVEFAKSNAIEILIIYTFAMISKFIIDKVRIKYLRRYDGVKE